MVEVERASSCNIERSQPRCGVDAMLNKADLREVTFADLQALQENQIPESHTLDYKRDFPFDKDGRLSLAADVVAFANTRGGDLILGIEEQGGFVSRFAPVQFDDRTIMWPLNVIVLPPSGCAPVTRQYGVLVSFA
jgi:hypothetical protein